MSRTEWTDDLYERLLDAVARATKAGFKRGNGKRTDDLGQTRFWQAVAVLMADGPDSPSEAACSTRIRDAVEWKCKQTTPITPEESAQLDAWWSEAGDGADEFVHVTLEELAEGQKQLLTTAEKVRAAVEELREMWR